MEHPGSRPDKLRWILFVPGAILVRGSVMLVFFLIIYLS